MLSESYEPIILQDTVLRRDTDGDEGERTNLPDIGHFGGRAAEESNPIVSTMTVGSDVGPPKLLQSSSIRRDCLSQGQTQPRTR